MRTSFVKEDMYTGGGFVLDSFEAHQADFVAVTSEDDFGAQFLADFTAAHAATKTLTGSGLNIGGVSQLTQQLYDRMDGVKPLVDRLDIRLGLANAKLLTVPVKNFGLGNLRRRIEVRDAEGTVKALGKLNAAIAANLTVLEPRGQNAAENKLLTDAETNIAEENRKQNKGQNNSTKGTVDENEVLKTFNTYLKKVMLTGRKLYKKNKQARRQYEQQAIIARMHAGERPKVRVGPDGK